MPNHCYQSVSHRTIQYVSDCLTAVYHLCWTVDGMRLGKHNLASVGMKCTISSPICWPCGAMVLMAIDQTNQLTGTGVLPFYRAILPHTATIYRLSVCLSVTFRYCYHTGWNTLKIISRPNRLRYLLTFTPTWAIWSNGSPEHPQN